MMAGQLADGMVIDAFGLLKAPRARLDIWRVAGIAVTAAGTVLVALGMS